MENEKWLIEIVDGRPRSYMDTKYLNKDITYYDESIEVNKSDIDISKINLYRLENDKLILDNNLIIEHNNNYKLSLVNKFLKYLSEIKTKYGEASFIFKDKYIQKNREIGDRNNLNNIILKMLVNNETEFNNWKITDKETGKDIYISLTLSDMKELASHMERQVTKSLLVETEVKNIITKYTLEELESLKEEDISNLYEKIWCSK